MRLFNFDDPSHRDTTALLPWYLNGTLDGVERARVERHRHLNLVVLEEALILSVLGFPIGFGLALLIYSAARNATHLPIYMNAGLASMVFGLTVLMCAGSGLIAVRKLGNVSARGIA